MERCQRDDMAFIHLIYDLDVVKRCYTCSHPNRAAIDAELLQGVSFRTVAGMYGLSPSALHRHRNEHMDEPDRGVICWSRLTSSMPGGASTAVNGGAAPRPRKKT